MKKIESFLVEDIEEKKVCEKNLTVKDNFFFLNSNVESIFSSDAIKERVLCIGEVQSGKTNNIIECIKKSLKLGYDAIIFFSGITNLLRNQSHERIERLNIENLKIFEPHHKMFINDYLVNNKKFLINVLKESKTFDDIFLILNNQRLLNKKILLIDDECDYGSVNTGSKLNPKFFHEKIEEIYKRIFQGKLLQFTATPFANILNDKCISSDIPRVVVLEKYNNYCGLHFFNSYGKNVYTDLYSEDNNIQTIYNCILIYLLSSVNLKFDETIKNKKSQLLLNVSQETEIHEQINKIVNTYLEEFQKNSYFEIEKDILNLKRYNFNFNFIFSLDFYIEEIKKITKAILDEKSIYILNSKELEQKEKYLKQKDIYQIIIGGTMLSRGLTFNYLITELLANCSDDIISLDTLLQRCRWFGDRKERIKYINIVLPRRLVIALKKAEKYLNLFKIGENNFFKLKSELTSLDTEFKKLYKIKGTSYGKSK